MWFGKNRSSGFWMSDSIDIKARGVEDILITVINNLNRSTQTIRSVFPQFQTKIYLVHKIRNDCK
jgi:transposase-like protein